MLLDSKPLDKLEESDIQSLIENQRREGKDIDYKIKSTSNSDGDKKEFLYDVASFANAMGGHLVIGMAEDDGLPTSLVGLDPTDIDAEILRLESIIRDGIEPRIPGISIKSIPLAPGKITLVIRIPRSWALPHMVSYQGVTKFYSRNSAGKYPLDVSEIRALFSISESVDEKIKNFRIERVSQILAGETPIPMSKHPKTVLHLIPLTSFDVSSRYDLSPVSTLVNEISPLNVSGWNQRFNFDGFLTYNLSSLNIFGSYLQIRCTGLIEAVETGLIKALENKKNIPGTRLENVILDGVSRYLSILRKAFNVNPPIVIQVSLLGVKGYTIGTNYPYVHDSYPIEKDMLLLPDVLVENFDDELTKTLKPLFDTFWNAAGWQGSISYDNNGNWIGR